MYACLYKSKKLSYKNNKLSGKKKSTEQKPKDIEMLTPGYVSDGGGNSDECENARFFAVTADTNCELVIASYAFSLQM